MILTRCDPDIDQTMLNGRTRPNWFYILRNVKFQVD